MSDKMIIDAHLHLWDEQKGRVNGKAVYGIGNGKSDFGGEVKQMLPPFMIDGKNTVEILISNMDFARVSGAVVTQEYIDGNQDDYLFKAKEKFPNRIKICSLYEEHEDYKINNYDGIKICAGRLKNKDLKDLLSLFKEAEEKNKFISIDLADGAEQVKEMEYLIKNVPNVKIAIGHFGMVTIDGWLKQIKLAQNKNVYIESGGITWLFHKEFYPYPSAIDAILQARDICGIDKLMWGSDYPRTMSAITYKMSYDFILKSHSLTEEEKDLFLGINAKKFYGFEEMEIPKYISSMVD
ncbi:MAG: amidohydrolase family protein [Lachnospirales bacterium]